MKSHRWKAWLPITHKAKPKKADVEWFKRVGVNAEQLTLALSVLHHVRHDVRTLVENDAITRFAMLVHDHASDKNIPHVDITLIFNKAVDARKFIHKPWRYITPAAENTAIAGINLKALHRPALERAEHLIYDQSAWYMKLITSYRSSTSNITLLKQVGQFLHFHANMSQLVVL